MSEVLKTEDGKEIIDIRTRWSEGKGIEDLDLDKVVLISGETPKDIEEKCLNLCKEYLSGNWSQQTTDTIEVRRLTGGLLNQMFYCGIRQPNHDEKVPQEVAIKIDGESPFKKELDRGEVAELAITLLFSERNIGPKIYGLYEGGQIQQFYKQREFKGHNEVDPQVIQKVFRTLARIHSYDFPIKRKASNQMQMIEKAYEEGIEGFNKLVEEFNSEIFKKYDLKTEIDWIKGVIERLDSPLVFCHSDYRSSNIMVTQPNDELVICDFDLSSYNYRGTDFTFMMMEWKKKHFIESLSSIVDLPLGDEMKPFIEIYVDECQQIYGKSFSENPNNSVKHIMNETKIFVMFWYFFHLAFYVRGQKEEEAKEVNNNEPQNAEDSKPPKDPNMKPELRMEKAEEAFNFYIKIKKILEEKKTFD